MNKKITYCIALFLVHTALQAGTPVAVSINFGLPPMMGCQSSVNALQVDCDILKFGVAPLQKSNAKVLQKAAGAYVMNSTSYTRSVYLLYTQFHVNGYFAYNGPAYTFARFMSDQPLVKLSGITPSGFQAGNYKYTAADYLIMAQNIHTGIMFGNTPTSSSVTAALVSYLKGRPYYDFSCTSGNLIGGYLPSKRTKAGGMSDLSNYLFDGCSVYKGSVWLANNADVVKDNFLPTSDSIRCNPDERLVSSMTQGTAATSTTAATPATLSGNPLNQLMDVNYESFASGLNGTNVKITDYFNGIGDNIDFYLPLHFADPGTTYIGIDLGN